MLTDVTIRPSVLGVLRDRDLRIAVTRDELYPTRVARILGSRAGFGVIGACAALFGAGVLDHALAIGPAYLAPSLGLTGIAGLELHAIAYGGDQIWAFLREMFDGRAAERNRRDDERAVTELCRCSRDERRDHRAVLAQHVATATTIVKLPTNARMYHLEKIPVALAITSGLQHSQASLEWVIASGFTVWVGAIAYRARASQHIRLIDRSFDRDDHGNDTGASLVTH